MKCERCGSTSNVERCPLPVRGDAVSYCVPCLDAIARERAWRAKR